MSVILVDDGEISYLNPIGDMARRIEDLLRAHDCLVAPFTGADPYSIGTYVEQYARHHTETHFLIDRNIYSDVLELAAGRPIVEGAKVSAAIMAFASCASITLEPAVAMHEGASTGARGGWEQSITLFRSADNIHPLNWAMLALGEADRFTKKIIRKKRASLPIPFDPKLKLRSFGFNYPVVLKLAILARRGGNRNARMRELID